MFYIKKILFAMGIGLTEKFVFFQKLLGLGTVVINPFLLNWFSFWVSVVIAYLITIFLVWSSVKLYDLTTPKNKTQKTGFLIRFINYLSTKNTKVTWLLLFALGTFLFVIYYREGKGVTGKMRIYFPLSSLTATFLWMILVILWERIF